jgi:uroporphyrinogen-III synthase
MTRKKTFCVSFFYSNFSFAILLFFSKAVGGPAPLRSNLLRAEDMPGYSAEAKSEGPKTVIKEEKLDDGTTIVVTNSHHQKQLLAEIYEDFPDEIKKIVAPFI